MKMIKVTSVRHAFPESAGFVIDRENGWENYTFLHFYNSVEIVLNGERIVTEPHAVILYDTKTPQYFKSELPLIHDWFHFFSDDFNFENFKLNTVLYPENYKMITKAVAEIESEFFGGKKNSEELIGLLTKEMFIKLDRNLGNEDESKVEKQTREQFRYLRGEVFSSLAADWTVPLMAERLNLSESRFYALYKSIFGISPTADIINARIYSAKNMLQFSNDKIEKIAAELGYKNTTHFIRQFKSSTGVTPSKYRLSNVSRR